MANFPVFHGISLAENSLIENLTIERLATDPVVLVAGRCWFNTTDKVLRYAGLDGGGGVIVNTLSTGSSSAAVLADANSYTDGKIAALVDSSPALLDTLNELAAALGDDPNFATTIASSVGTVSNAVGTLANLTTTDKSSLVVALNEVDADIAAEAVTRAANDSTLQGNIDTEAGTRASGDSNLQGQVGTLANLTTASKTNLVVAVNELNANAATAATALTDGLAAEALARATAIGVETTNRTNADTALQTQIGTLSSLTTTEKTSLVLAINELVDAGAGLGDANAAAIAAEALTRATADTTLQDNIDAEAVTRAADDVTLATAISTEATNRTTAIAAEATARDVAIAASATTIQGLIDTEATARANGDADRVLKAGDIMEGNLAFQGTYTVTGLINPADPTDAATKAYVDSLASGLVWLDPVTLINFTGSSTTPIASPILYDSYLIDTGGATGSWAAFAVGDVVQCTNASGPVWTKVTQISVGQHYIVSGITETAPIGIAAGHLTEYATVTNATPGAFAMTFTAPIVGNASFVGDSGAALFGRSYTYAVDAGAPIGNPTHSWIQFGGPGSTGAGVGLVYSGNVLNINLGAGIAQLPSDEVGIDLYATGGLMLTEDGTAASTNSAAQLALKLDGTSLTTGAGGLKVSLALTSEVTAATAAIAQELLDRAAADTTLQGNITTEATTRSDADVALQGLIDTEVTNRTNADIALQGSIDALTTAVGGGVAAEATARSDADLVLQGNIDAEALARSNADTTLQGNITTLSGTVTTFRDNVNNSRFTFLAGAAAVQHTISHNLNSAFVDFTVLVQRDNGKFRNDVVSVEATDDNTLTVYLTESRVIKASVVALSNAL